jgi:hypothetical protein
VPDSDHISTKEHGRCVLPERSSGSTTALSEGERVEFDIVQGDKGPAAQNVVRLDS